MDLEKAAEVLATMEARPTVTRELLMRWIAEAWLEGQRRRGVFGGIQLRPQTSGLTFAIVSRRCLRLTPRSTWGLGRKP